VSALRYAAVLGALLSAGLFAAVAAGAPFARWEALTWLGVAAVLFGTVWSMHRSIGLQRRVIARYRRMVRDRLDVERRSQTPGTGYGR
jgi:hypothetical protein